MNINKYKNSEILVSVIIVTRNRFEKLLFCLEALSKNSFKNFEVIVIDQSDTNKFKKFLLQQSVKFHKLVYIKVDYVGKSKGLNHGFGISRGQIVAFTDDDCISSKHWLKNIVLSFQNYPKISSVFGKILPYKKKNIPKNLICPATFKKNKPYFIYKPCCHWQNIGFGNNMAFRKKLLEKIGKFKEWLGPGSIGLAAEDAELTLRSLLKGYKLFYNPKIQVYHNRWLKKEKYRKQCLSYSCGEMACYGYFGFQDLMLGKKVVVNNFKDSYNKIKYSIKSIIFLRKNCLKILLNTFEELFYRLRGFVVALYYSKKKPLSY